MAKKQNRDGQNAEYPIYEKDNRTDEEKDEARLLARKALEYIRKHVKLKKSRNTGIRSVREILENPGPQVDTVRLDDKPTVDVCRCGLKPLVPDWSAMGIENPPQVCPGCKDLVERCHCSP